MRAARECMADAGRRIAGRFDDNPDFRRRDQRERVLCERARAEFLACPARSHE
jgi:hypothetical protein